LESGLQYLKRHRVPSVAAYELQDVVTRIIRRARAIVIET
jgi:hypothetical protein